MTEAGARRSSIKSGAFTVTGVPVAGGKTRTLSVVAEPEKGLKAGTHAFQIDAATKDGALTASQQITVTTQARSGTRGADLVIATSYPVLRGQSDARFEFSLDVTNKAGKGHDPTREPRQVKRAVG